MICNYCGGVCSGQNMVQTRSGRKLITKYYCDDCVRKFKEMCKRIDYEVKNEYEKTDRV